MDRRRVSPLFERRFKFPDRRIARTPDRVERQARPSLAAMVFDFEPTGACPNDSTLGLPLMRWHERYQTTQN
jgi:hypothetical protein